MPKLLLVFLVSGLALIAACGSQPQYATLAELSSSGVTVNGAAASAGQALKQEDEVKVDGANAYARIVLPEGVRVFLRPDAAGGATTFNLGRHVEQGSAKAMLFKLVKGVAYFVVPKRKPGDALEVQASWTTTAVKGTEFKVETSDAGDSVSVKEGAVEVRPTAGGASTAVGALVKSTYDSQKKQFAAAAYDDAMSDAESSMFGANGAPIIKRIEN
jgi:hypothetical protein